MSSKKPTNTAQSFAAYIQQNKNSTNALDKSGDKSTAQRLVEKRKENEKIIQDNQFANYMLKYNPQTIWNQKLEASVEEYRFKNAINPEPVGIEPKQVSYEKAKKRFDEYDHYVDNPISYRDFYKSHKPGNASYLTYIKPKSLDDYVVFIDPAEQGYIRPEGDESSYNEKLSRATTEYLEKQPESINLEKIVDSSWDEYLESLRGWYRDFHINAKLDAYYDKHDTNTESRYYDTYSKLSPVIHSSNITSQILETFPKDPNNSDNVIINGETFPSYFVYKQIFNIATSKFGDALMRDAENSDGLGRIYLDEEYKKAYGMTYQEYMKDVYYNRIKEIRNEIDALGNKMAKSYTTENFSNEIHAGFSSMGVMLPDFMQEALADWIAESYTTHPFVNVVEALDATMAAIEGGSFSKGFQSGFDAINLVSFGVSEVGGSFKKLEVLEKVRDGKILTEDEQYIYDLVKLEEELNGLYKGLDIKKPIMAEIGSGVGTFVADMPTFGIGMGVTSGVGEGVKYGTKFAYKRFLREKSFNTAKNLAKRASIDFTKAYGVFASRGAIVAPFTSFTYRSYADKALNQYSFDENGNLKFTPTNKWAMAAGAFLDGTNEFASEFWGAGVFNDAISMGSKAFGRATGISKWLNKTEVGTWLRRVSQAPMSDATKKTLRNLGYTGILSEPLSEVWGDYMTSVELMFLDNTVNLIKDGKDFEWKREGRSFDTGYSFENFKDPDYWITIMGVSTISGGAMTSVAAGRNILSQAKYAKKVVNAKKASLNAIENEELKSTLRLLGESENFVNAAIELANFDWRGKGISLADKVNAINYLRNSYILQTTMGDMEGQRHMMSFEDTISHYNDREFISEGGHTGRIYTAVDAQGNTYNVLNIEGQSEDGDIFYRVIDDAGNISVKLASEFKNVKKESIDSIIADEYSNTFSSEIESTRLNNVRQTFERIFNPTEVDIRRLTSEFGIRKPEVGKTVKLVDGTEATIKEDLKNGNYIIERYNPETTEKEDIEIPVHHILSNNPITAAAQKKMLEDTEAVKESGNPSVVPESHKSSEDKVNDIINADYDSKLFGERGTVKLNEEQIISTFSTEDPNILGDYIKKVGNRVSPQVKKALSNALELSKKHNEINSHISNAYQHNATKSDVADLVNTLNKATKAATPQMTTEEIITSIIDNPNTPSAIREDFSNILKDINNNHESKQATTKTKTSVTQKDVKGKRGRKQIEKGIKDLRKALKDNNPIDALNAINLIDDTLSKVEEEPITTKEKQFVEETRKTLKEQGYEIQPMRGMNYHEGMKATVQMELNPELPTGTQIIKGVRKPQINKDGVMVQSAEIIVEQGPAIEEETPDISQAVTKEMTENEPIDFSEPTDNTVEPKKEDSIPQDTTEQEFTIPELERAFAIPDSDKLIETPSREEEVETLTDEQRAQVRIHNENGTDLVDYISDSALPDDQSTDEVIVDKHELQGNRIYRYNGEQLRNNQAQVRRIPKKEGDNHDLVYKWLDENSIDLQGIIDNELAAIAALDTDVRFMMMTAGTKSGYSAGSPMLNTVFQVVEYTDAIKRIHNERRGGVITSNGKEYLLIGITGFSTPKPGIFNPEAAHYNFIADKVLKSARNSYTSQTDEISRDAYYVHPTMSTRIKNIEAGWIVTQTTEDSGKQSRSLGELLADETRNPYGITAANSKWLIPTRNSAKPIKVRVDPTDVVHGLKIPTGLAGSLFLLVPAANGHYIPVSVKIQTTNELADGTLKDTIWEVAQNLLSTEKETRDYAIKELCKLLNLTKEGYNIFIDDSEIDFDNPNSAKIVFTQNGIRMATEIQLSSPNASAELYNTIFSNIPFQLNIGLQTLVSGELQAYIDAGALITDAALLGTTNASYTVHSVGPDLKADPYTENSTESQEGSYENSDLRRTQDNGIINYGNNSYSVVAEGQYRNTVTGELVTSAKMIKEIETHIWLERYKPVPSKIEQDSKAKLYILGVDEVISVSKNGIITFYSKERSIEIIDEINRENIEESRINNAVEELARIEEQQQAEQVIPQELQEEENASIPEVTFTEDFDAFNTPEISPVEDSFTEVSFGEAYSPKEEVSATLTEGVVENTDASQLYIDDYLGNIEEQLIDEGMSEEEINAFMDKILLQLEEQGMGTYYTKEQESIIKTIVDNIKNCH